MNDEREAFIPHQGDIGPVTLGGLAMDMPPGAHISFRHGFIPPYMHQAGWIDTHGLLRSLNTISQDRAQELAWTPIYAVTPTDPGEPDGNIPR